MIYINENKYRQNSNSRIGWIISESAPDLSLVESTRVVKTMSNGRRVVGEGTLQRAESRNRNSRWYSKAELFPQLTCPRTIELLSTGQMLGESGHPLSQELQRQATIDPTNTIVRYLRFWTEGDLVKGEFIGTNNALGESFDQDLRDGYKPAFSLRALGSIVNTNNGAEVRGIKLITYDQVVYPSHPEAYTDGLIYEGANYVKNNNGILVRVDESVTSEQKKILENGLVVPITNQDVLDCIQQESYNFNTITKTFDTFYDSIKLVNEATCVQISNSQTGDSFIIQLENFIHNELIKYCTK